MAVKKKQAQIKKAAKKSGVVKKVPKSNAGKDAEKVALHMNALTTSMKPEIEAVRNIIKKASPKIGERIKWNAPSYYYKEDLVTFNAWARDNVHLVFHHPVIVKIKSVLLEGDYTSRRMMYFKDMKEVKRNKSELERIIRELIRMMDEKN